MKDYSIKMQENRTLKLLKGLAKDANNDIILVGGSIFDIIDDKEPKDYDILNWTNKFKIYLEMRALIISDSLTAITYDLDGSIIQLLKTKQENFHFTIASNSSYKIISGTLNLDISYVNKMLIPTKWDKETLIDCLYMLPKWQAKGFTINPITYSSIIEEITGVCHVNHS